MARIFCSFWHHPFSFSWYKKQQNAAQERWQHKRNKFHTTQPSKTFCQAAKGIYFDCLNKHFFLLKVLFFFSFTFGHKVDRELFTLNPEPEDASSASTQILEESRDEAFRSGALFTPATTSNQRQEISEGNPPLPINK